MLVVCGSCFSLPARSCLLTHHWLVTFLSLEKHMETDLSRSPRFHLVVLGLGLGVARLGNPGDHRGPGPTQIFGVFWLSPFIQRRVLSTY